MIIDCCLFAIYNINVGLGKGLFYSKGIYYRIEKFVRFEQQKRQVTNSQINLFE